MKTFVNLTRIFFFIHKTKLEIQKMGQSLLLFCFAVAECPHANVMQTKSWDSNTALYTQGDMTS